MCRRPRLILCLLMLGLPACGQLESAGTIEGERLPAALVSSREADRARAAEAVAASARAATPTKQILFGDLHVHTTFSADAFMMGLPILQGEGARPVADACDYARYCSALDFWSINDHAESLTQRRWQETKQTIRECNERAGDPANPDVVAFLGWEWTQVGRTPDDHYGHKNVVLRDLEDDRVPTRPIDSDSFATQAMRQGLPLPTRLGLPLLDWSNRQRYFDLIEFLAEISDTPRCPKGVDVRALPDDCMEGAATPALLFEKLDQWGFAATVIPHGTSWGIYTPPASAWDKQLVGAMHDPDRQRNIEVFSGHGNSEEYRDWRATRFDADGRAVCPAPTPGYEPCCWRAGEIIRDRCDDGDSEVCEERVARARRHYVAAGAAGRHTVPGTELTDWQGCGQCTDCFLPSQSHRPASSVQYIMSRTDFTGDADPRRFHFGFIASSDNHSARPGTGYKEIGRNPNTEARGPRSEAWSRRFNEPAAREAGPEPVAVDMSSSEIPAFLMLDFERQASYFLTGGLAAVHATGRDRGSVWDALQRREVYGTSGERMLLWFDLLNGPDGETPMGSAVGLGEDPRFRVRAVGSFVQKPGCPPESRAGLSTERLDTLCHGECYHPGDTRHPIDRIEVVRIRPQATPDEPARKLIEDPWKVLPCAPDPAGCVVEFEDPEFDGSSRPHLYYVRALQPPTPIVNAGLERCETDADGRCLEARPCYGDYRTDKDDDCLAEGSERAWSSPIYLQPR